MRTAALRFRVNILGAVAFTVYLSMALLSYLQAPALWRSREDVPQANAFFDALVERIPAIGLHRFFEGNAAIIVSYFVPLAIATAAAVLVVLMLIRRGGMLDTSVVTLLLRWSLAFSVVCLFAFPVFTQDFWLSAAWGRMVAVSLNPYHEFFTPDLLVGLPLDHFPMLMSYGPAWAILSGAVMTAAGKSVLMAAILFKAILGAAWIGSLVLVTRITEARPVLDRCLAVALFGWMPVGVTQTLAEGHNDVAMVYLALLWMFLLLRGRWMAPVALVASALAKYVTGPLLLVDAIAALRMHRLSWRQMFLRLIVPGLLGVAVFAAFFRSLQFFDGAKLVNEWRFLQPRDAVAALELTLDISLYPAELFIAAGFVGLTAFCLIGFFRGPTPENALKAALAIMSAISFAVAAHLWPWYLVWTLAFAALLPAWWMSRFVIGVSILAPFTLAVWWVDLFANSKEWAALALYAGALLWAALTRSPDLAQAPARGPEEVAERPSAVRDS